MFEQAMTMSLEGIPDPLKKSTAEHAPSQIVFLASHDSVTWAGDVLSSTTPWPQTVLEITEASNSIFTYYKAYRRCVERIKPGVHP
jgi:hypothetical protein